MLSSDGPEHHLVRKRREYARVGCAEYWIVSPAAVQLFEDVTVDVAAVLDAM
jgi:Uma2 family endonuclease